MRRLGSAVSPATVPQGSPGSWAGTGRRLARIRRTRPRPARRTCSRVSGSRVAPGPSPVPDHHMHRARVGAGPPLAVAEAVDEGEGALAQLLDPELHLDEIPVAHGSLEPGACLGDGQGRAPWFAQPGIQGQIGRLHQVLVGIMGMAQQVGEEQHPGGVRVVQSDPESVAEGKGDHAGLRVDSLGSKPVPGVGGIWIRPPAMGGPGPRSRASQPAVPSPWARLPSIR